MTLYIFKMILDIQIDWILHIQHYTYKLHQCMLTENKHLIELFWFFCSIQFHQNARS